MEAINVDDVVLKETSPWLVFKTFRRKIWWSNAIVLTKTFAPNCILPAALSVLALCVWFGAMFIVMSRSSQINEISEAVKMFITAIVCLAASGIAYMWSVGLWLVRITAMARAASSFSEEQWQAPFRRENVVEHITEAMRAVKERKNFIAKFYLLITVYMLAPIVCFTVCMGCSFGLKLVHIPGLVLPQWFEISSAIGMIASGIFIAVLSMISIVVSASCKLDIQKSVYRTIGLSVNCFLPCLLLTLITGAMLAVTTEPFSPFIYSHTDLTLNVQAFVIMVANSLWQNLASIFMVPFIVVPFCELLRGRFE